MSLHEPLRPRWCCLACGRPWPCGTRQRQLIASYADAYASLDLFLTQQFVIAAQDLPATPAGTLFRQFLGWRAELLQLPGGPDHRALN
jgi:hypothetical protein